MLLEVEGELELAPCAANLSAFYARSAETPGERRRREARARALCASCALLEQCRDRARRERLEGVWGAESDDDRRRAVEVEP